MSIATLFIVVKIWEQLQSSSPDEWVTKRWYIYIYIYIRNTTQSLKKNEILPFAATWIVGGNYVK